MLEFENENYVATEENEARKEQTRNRLVADLLLMILAGLDTTSHTTEVGILLLAKYPDIQQTVYNVKLCDVMPILCMDCYVVICTVHTPHVIHVHVYM